MPEFELTIKRTETYIDTIKVHAATRERAIAETQDILDEEGWDGMFVNGEEGERQECVSEVVVPVPTKTFIVTEVVEYEVEARSEEHACEIITQAEERDMEYFVQVSDRYATEKESSHPRNI